MSEFELKLLLDVSNRMIYLQNVLMPSCQSLCMHVGSVVSDSGDPMDCSPSDSSVHGIFQARILERGAISYSRLDGLLNCALK